jgi:hypothetical protein
MARVARFSGARDCTRETAAAIIARVERLATSSAATR